MAQAQQAIGLRKKTQATWRVGKPEISAKGGQFYWRGLSRRDIISSSVEVPLAFLRPCDWVVGSSAWLVTDSVGGLSVISFIPQSCRYTALFYVIPSMCSSLCAVVMCSWKPMGAQDKREFYVVVKRNWDSMQIPQPCADILNVAGFPSSWILGSLHLPGFVFMPILWMNKLPCLFCNQMIGRIDPSLIPVSFLPV